MGNLTIKGTSYHIFNENLKNLASESVKINQEKLHGKLGPSRLEWNNLKINEFFKTKKLDDNVTFEEFTLCLNEIGDCKLYNYSGCDVSNDENIRARMFLESST